MLTYNALLYTERMNRGLSRRKMAKLLRLSLFNYTMIENGYFKPTKKQIEKISLALEVDYKRYLVGEPSYPCELPEKKKNKLVRAFYRLVGTIAFKVIFAVLSGASIAFMISGFVVGANVTKNIKSYYSEEYVTFVENLRTNGMPQFSATSSLVRPEYRHYEKFEDGTSKYISITGYYKDESIGSILFNAIYRNETSRLLYTLSISSYSVDVIAKYSEYDTAISYITTFKDGKEPSIVSYIDNDGKKAYYLPTDEPYQGYVNVLGAKLNQYKNDFNELIAEKDPTFAVDYEQKCDRLISLRQEGAANMNKLALYSFFGRYFGILLSGLNLFILAYALLYGTTKKGAKVYKEAKFEVAVDEVHRMKTDIRLMPFIPETLIEIIGIILVFIGSFRLVYYASSFLTGNAASAMSSSTGTDLMQTFMVGMFLLYFIDFDIFMDDKRVFRNIVLYSIIFFCLYGLENLFYRVINNDSIVGQLMNYVSLPNMFGSIAGYYCIMMFLFYTPKFLKKNYQLVIFRCLSIIPAVYIFVAWYLYNGYNVLFTADWPNEVRNLFNAEKIPFSILAISYLFGLYFMRLFFIKRYGQDRAMTFFNGNRFLWCKNIMVTVIIIIIAIVEISLKNNITAHKLGLGMYWNIVFLIPLLFFYHPHKGPRNLILDWTTLFFYILAITLSYIAVIVMVISKLFT